LSINVQHNGTGVGSEPTLNFEDSGDEYGWAVTDDPANLRLDIQVLSLFSVKLFGANGDGTTDDTAAIKRAIAANSIVYFPPGVYICSSALTQSSNTAWVGPTPTGDYSNSNPIAGAKLVFTGSNAGTSCITSSGNPVVRAALKNLTIYASGTYDWIFDFSNTATQPQPGPVSVAIWSVSAGCAGTTTGGWRSQRNGTQSFLQEWVDFEIALPANSTAYALDCDFSDSSIIGGKFVGGLGAIFRGTGAVKCCGVFFSTMNGTGAVYDVTISNETSSGSDHLFVGCEFDSLASGSQVSNGVKIDGDASPDTAPACVPVFTGCHFRSGERNRDHAGQHDWLCPSGAELLELRFHVVLLHDPVLGPDPLDWIHVRTPPVVVGPHIAAPRSGELGAGHARAVRYGPVAYGQRERVHARLRQHPSRNHGR
jgi:hypothetical protein